MGSSRRIVGGFVLCFGGFVFRKYRVLRRPFLGIIRAQALGHKLARNLKVGDWVAVQARERWSTKEEVHYRAGVLCAIQPPHPTAPHHPCSHRVTLASGHFWLGRIVDAGQKHFLGDGVLKQVTKRRDDINGTMFTEGDIAIAIQWYDRVDGESDGLSFEKWVDTEGDASKQDIINSTELRASSSTPFENGLHFTMALQQPIEPAFKPPPSPVVRRSGRKAAVQEVAAPPPPPDDALWDMPALVDEQIRRGCWLGGQCM